MPQVAAREYLRRDLEQRTGRKYGPDLKPLPLVPVKMRAPKPHANYYMSGVNGRAGRYSADGDGIIAEVHPDDIERLEANGCVRL